MRTQFAMVLMSIACLGLSSCVGESEKPDAGQSADPAPLSDFGAVKTPPPVFDLTPADEKPPAADMPATAGQSGIEIVPKTDALPPRRESVVGRWEFRLSNFVEDIVGLLVDIQSANGEYTVAILDDSPMMPDWSIQSSELTDHSVRIQFANHKGDAVDFDGLLGDDGILRGSVSFGSDGLDPAFLYPSQLESLADAEQRAPAQGVEKLDGFQPDPQNPFVELRTKARELIPSALAYHFFRSLSARARQEAPEPETFAGFPEDYLAAAAPWGPRIVTAATLDMAYTCAITGFDPALAQQYLTDAEKQLGETASESQQARLRMARGLLSLHSTDPTEQQAGVDLLTGILQKNPFDASAILALAAFHERAGQLEQAVAEYATLAALPGAGGDMGPVVRIWKELGRDPKAVDAFLDEVYRTAVYQFADEQSDAPRAEGTQRTVLGELFTGGSCPPCVAADIASGGLEKTYPKTDFIMLRYHQHVPAPDSLATPAGDQRAIEYYEIGFTPTLMINGSIPESVTATNGPLAYAPAGYAELRELVDPLLSESSNIQIDLQATAAGEAIDLTATVTGPETLPDTWRLRICVAEDEISYPANNGIRLHEMVVRAMPGGAEGTAPAENVLRFEGTVSLQEIRDQIRAYLVRIPGLSPPPLDLKHLHIVAFVQDDADRTIQQATTVPVTFDAPAAAGDTPAPEPAATSEASETSETPKPADTPPTPEAPQE